MILLITIVILGSVFVCGEAARRRGLSVPRWIALSLVFGPLAIPFVFLVRGKNTSGDES